MSSEFCSEPEPVDDLCLHRIAVVEYSIPMTVRLLLDKKGAIVARGLPEPSSSTEVTAVRCLNEDCGEDLDELEEQVSAINAEPDGVRYMEEGVGFIIGRVPNVLEHWQYKQGEHHSYPVFWLSDGSIEETGEIEYIEEDESWTFSPSKSSSIYGTNHEDYWINLIESKVAKLIPEWEIQNGDLSKSATST